MYHKSPDSSERQYQTVTLKRRVGPDWREGGEWHDLGKSACSGFGLPLGGEAARLFFARHLALSVEVSDTINYNHFTEMCGSHSSRGRRPDTSSSRRLALLPHRPFWVPDLYWRSQESGDLLYKSSLLGGTMWSHSEGWSPHPTPAPHDSVSRRGFVPAHTKPFSFGMERYLNHASLARNVNSNISVKWLFLIASLRVRLKDPLGPGTRVKKKKRRM